MRIKFNRGQAMSLWAVMSELGPEAHIEIFEQRDDDEIWIELHNEFGAVRRLALPASGGRREVEAEPVERPDLIGEGVEEPV